MKKAIELIKKHEGLSLKAYRCPAGVWTIGYGHTRDVDPQQTITAAQAETLLIEDVAILRRQLTELADAYNLTLNENRMAALLSFGFNVGLGALKRSTLWKKLVINQDDSSIADEFARWKYANGKVLPGLVSRRKDESELYFEQ